MREPILRKDGGKERYDKDRKEDEKPCAIIDEKVEKESKEEIYAG